MNPPRPLPYLLAFIGITIFSLSFPMTKIAVRELDPYFVVSLRTLIAGILGATWLLVRRPALGTTLSAHGGAVIGQVLGVVIGFPLLSSLALKKTGAAHAALLIAATPILTAAFSAGLFRRRRSVLFWVLAGGASATIMAAEMMKQGFELKSADALLLLSAVVVAAGYAFGAKASSCMGGITAISLATAAALPMALLGTIFFWPAHIPGAASILATGYLGAMSMFVGFVFWYEGLSRGPSEHVSLVQSFQLFLTYLFSALFLQETISTSDLWPAMIVAACVLGAKVAK